MAVALPQSPVVQLVALDEGADPCQALLEVVAIIDRALDNGAKLIDLTSIARWEFTADVIGKRRKDLWVAFRFGVSPTVGDRIADSTPPGVRKTCEEALRLLGLGFIDFFYQEIPDPATPIEQTVAELKALVEEGKVRTVGIATDSPTTVARAHSVHPIAAVALEWSLWRPRSLDSVVLTCRERGIRILAKTPCGGALLDASHVESDEASGTMKALLEDRSRVLVEKLQTLVDKPSCELVDSLREFISEETSRCLARVEEMVTAQSCELQKKISALTTGANGGMVKFLGNIVENQQSCFLSKMKTIMARQSWKMMEKVGVLKEPRGGQCIATLKILLRKQKSRTIETLARLRSRQEEVFLLKAEGYMVGPTTTLISALKGFLVCQKAELLRLITDERSNMNLAILERIRFTCAEHQTRIAAKVLVMKDKQSTLLIRRIRKLMAGLSCPKTGLQNLELALQAQKEELVQHTKLFSTTDKDWVLASIQRLIQRHIAETVQHIKDAVDHRNIHLNNKVMERMGECDQDCVISPETRKVLVDISLAVSERVKEVAFSRDCPPQSVALAWLAHQGEDVMVMLLAESGSAVEQDILACKMKLTEQELSTLCVGAGDDREGWKVDTPSGCGATTRSGGDGFSPRAVLQERTLGKYVSDNS